MNTYYVEMTDTFGGEANYCWIKRFKVTANSMQHAMSKVSRETGYHYRKVYDTGDFTRYNARNACICCFIEYFDSDIQSRMYYVKDLQYIQIALVIGQSIMY